MPKLVLPVVHKTRLSTIEMRSYEKGKLTHVRALARYLFRYVHGRTTSIFLKALLPSLTDAQLENIIHVRLQNLANIKLDQLEEISNSIGKE
jgi:predicted transcriptional regulator